MASAHQYRLEAKPGYLLVWQAGLLDTEADARAFQLAIERAADAAGLRRLIFDNRETDAPPERVRDSMFDWVSKAGRFDRVALLLSNSMVTVRVNMSALSRRAPIRAFSVLAEAERWIAHG